MTAFVPGKILARSYLSVLPRRENYEFHGQFVETFKTKCSE